jgi:exonuclease VII small subunit
MNSLELLNVLDVIKNEEIYTKRLEQLKAVQEKLNKSKYIILTATEAEEKLEDAIQREKKADELVKKLEQDLKKVKEEVDKDYKEKFEKVARSYG